MGFFKNQQVKLAMRLLAWQYQRNGQSQPEASSIEQHARKLVDDAHRIAKERGGNVMAILKETIGNIRR